jgi:hypothetical protein
MRPFIGKILLHRITLSILNICILVLGYSAFRVTWFSGESNLHEIREAVELWEGFGTIILGMGVALEERDGLKKIAGYHDHAPSFVDHVCHDYGVLFAVLGVIIEAFAWLVKIPNEVLNTEGIEFILLQVAAVVSVIAVILQIRFQYYLWFGKKKFS